MNKTINNDTELISILVSFLLFFIMMPICCICDCICKNRRQRRNPELYTELP